MFNYSLVSLKKHWLLGLSTLILTIFLLAFHQQPTFSQSSNSAEILVKDRGGIAINRAHFSRVEYVGQCTGETYVPSKLAAQFVSNTTPPASGRRAIIRNITRGMNSNPYPFTDREYSSGSYSEGFDLQIGYSHSQRDFSVINGENRLEYEIKESNGNITERGTINLQVSIDDEGVFSRNSICREEWQCVDERRDDRDDRVCRTNRICTCP
ncbi:MAG: hypothetical protein SW833_26165 [Cyanobacteriota bacterium]|nr:hypothetical protein [Cyanobacteriota bacterium]